MGWKALGGGTLGRGREAQGASKLGGAAAARGSQWLREAGGGGPPRRAGSGAPSLPVGRGCRSSGGAEGLPEPGGPRPLLLGSGSHPPAGELVSLEPLHVVASVAATVLSPFPRLRAPHWPTQLSPLASSSAEQAQLPDGRGRPRCTRTLPALRFLGIFLC